MTTFTRDCPPNGIEDSCEIAADPTLDCDGNGYLDTCDTLNCGCTPADAWCQDCDPTGYALNVCEITNCPIDRSDPIGLHTHRLVHWGANGSRETEVESLRTPAIVAGHRLQCVQDQVGQHNLELSGVDPQWRQLFFERALNRTVEGDTGETNFE